jgi:hypothetical protein
LTYCKKTYSPYWHKSGQPVATTWW